MYSIYKYYIQISIVCVICLFVLIMYDYNLQTNKCMLINKCISKFNT